MPVRRKKVLLVVFPVVALFCGQKGVSGAKRSWRGSLVSGERRHLMKEVWGRCLLRGDGGSSLRT